MEKKKQQKKVKIVAQEILLSEGVQANIENKKLTLKGEKGEVSRTFNNPRIDIKLEGNKITLKPKKPTKKEKRIANTFAAHINNMIKGTTEGHTYLLKICSGHFPMNITVQNNQFQIKNFFGEQKPRILQLQQGVDVKIEGDIVKVESSDLELAGRTAAEIERLASRFGFDKRIFQDGVYIIEKNGKQI